MKRNRNNSTQTATRLSLFFTLSSSVSTCSISLWLAAFLSLYVLSFLHTLEFFSSLPFYAFLTPFSFFSQVLLVAFALDLPPCVALQPLLSALAFVTLFYAFSLFFFYFLTYSFRASLCLLRLHLLNVSLNLYLFPSCHILSLPVTHSTCTCFFSSHSPSLSLFLSLSVSVSLYVSLPRRVPYNGHLAHCLSHCLGKHPHAVHSPSSPSSAPPPPPPPVRCRFASPFVAVGYKCMSIVRAEVKRKVGR